MQRLCGTKGGMLPFLKPNSAIDWSVSHVQSVMCTTKSCPFNVALVRASHAFRCQCMHLHFPDVPVGGRDRNLHALNGRCYSVLDECCGLVNGCHVGTHHGRHASMLSFRCML